VYVSCAGLPSFGCQTRENDREAMLLSVCTSTFKKGVIAFFERKQAAHRMYLLMHFLGLRVGELHGNLSQQQRTDAYDNFKKGDIDLLMATDLASRGLDIQVLFLRLHMCVIG
jgi:ATP-dependent RNA helicase DDX27